MQVLILHNARAGTGRLSKRQLVRPFERAGHRVRYRSIHESHWKRRLASADIVVAVGGDGTIADVAIALARQGDSAPPLVVIPAGKANNIARALGARASVSRIAKAIEGRPATRSLAVGLIRSPWGRARFVESAGIGPLAVLLRTEVPTLRGARALLRKALRNEPLHELRIRVDGRDRSGRYVAMHVMNIDAVGPRLVYAPRADAGDRRLDLVLLTAADRVAFDRYLHRLASGRPVRCPVTAIRARRIEIAPWRPRDSGYIDDQIWPEEKRPKQGRVRIEVETTISVLVPGA